MHTTARLPSWCSLQNCQIVSFSHTSRNVIYFFKRSSFSPVGLNLKAPLCKGKGATSRSSSRVAIAASEHCCSSNQTGFPGQFSHQTQGKGFATTGQYLQSHRPRTQPREGHQIFRRASNNDEAEGAQAVESLTDEVRQQSTRVLLSMNACLNALRVTLQESLFCIFSILYPYNLSQP